MEGECGLSVDLTLDVKGHIARDLGGIDPEVAGELVRWPQCRAMRFTWWRAGPACYRLGREPAACEVSARPSRLCPQKAQKPCFVLHVCVIGRVPGRFIWRGK